MCLFFFLPGRVTNAKIEVLLEGGFPWK